MKTKRIWGVCERKKGPRGEEREIETEDKEKEKVRTKRRRMKLRGMLEEEPRQESKGGRKGM
jgi:hypothetical protein